MTFSELGLKPEILSALADQKYTTPSPIQERAIPPALEGRDVLGCAQTGTGKTCAFATPILQRLDKPAEGRPVRALILTPTRELALQIFENIYQYGKNTKLHAAVIFGGVSQGPQVAKLKQGVDILVATPGRLTDLYQQKLLNLSKVEIFVLDEADRMLDMGFIHDVKKVLQWLPKQKQTLLFSATMPKEISELVDSLLVNPVKVEVNPVSSPVEVITQELYYVDKHNKSNLLAHIMKERGIETAIVFTRTKHGANKVVKDLEKFKISAAAIHGNKSQTARQQALSAFKEGKIQCLVATDIAARGIDIDQLSYVFNYNLPEVPETYVHRIGRTGRAGRDGVAMAFCDFGEKPLLKDIEKLMGKKVDLNMEHPFPMSVFEVPKKDRSGRIINSEDEDARNAARERRRLRDEENKAGRKERRTSVGQENNHTNHNNDRNSGKRGSRRGQRSGEVMHTGNSRPNTNVQRTNPLHDGEQVMDATARMLAPKEKTGKPHRQSNRNQANHQPYGKQEGNHVVSTQRKKGEGRNSRPNQNGGTNYQTARKEQGNGRNQGYQNNRGRRGPRDQYENPPHAASTKDSTEQSSLMKPFYLDF